MSQQIEKIKSLAKSLDEFSLLSYAKRGVLFILEFMGWIMVVFLCGLALYILFYNFQIEVKIDKETRTLLTLENENLKTYQTILTVILFTIDIPILLTTLYLRRLRRKKSQLFELISEIKKL